MENVKTPEIFKQLLSDMCIEPQQILSTADGFFLAYKSLSEILAGK